MKKAVIAIVVGLVLVAMIIAFGQIFTVRFVAVEFSNAVSVTTEQQILDLSGIDSRTNIFVLDEKNISTKIENGFSDSVVKVDDVIREFPNKVTIKISERIAIFRINASTADGDGCVTVDRNFQRSKIYSVEETQDMVLIDVIGTEIKNTYRTDECYALKNVADALVGNGLAEEALAYFIKSIEFTDTEIIIDLRATETKFVLQKNSENLYYDVASVYEQYLLTDVSMRDNEVFYC